MNVLLFQRRGLCLLDLLYPVYEPGPVRSSQWFSIHPELSPISLFSSDWIQKPGKKFKPWQQSLQPVFQNLEMRLHPSICELQVHSSANRGFHRESFPERFWCWGKVFQNKNSSKSKIRLSIPSECSTVCSEERQRPMALCHPTCWPEKQPLSPRDSSKRPREGLSMQTEPPKQFRLCCNHWRRP